MECHLNKLETGISLCMEKAEFHVGKGERKKERKKKKPAYLKPDPGIPAILWLVNIFILSLPSHLPIFFPFMFL